jgi:hypothetical protein
MTESSTVFIIGTAGSGKTIFTAAFRRYLADQDVDVISVNLDPAVQRVPYTCEIDARDYINIQDLIDKYELGPNGAMITAIDLVASEMQAIKGDIDDYNAEAILIDTPGQLEVFVYRSSGPIITREFSADSTACLFLMDSNLVRTPSSWISLNLLAMSTQFRLELPMIYGLSKMDLLVETELQQLEQWSEDIDIVVSELSSYESANMKTLSLNLVDALRDIQAHVPLIPVSALNETGLDAIAAHLSRIWRKGDDWII